MKLKRVFLLSLVLAMMPLPAALADGGLSATLSDNVLKITWSAEGECVLTIYRNNWPISVCTVNGSDGGTTCYVERGGAYSVRLKSAAGCETVSVAAAECPTEAPAAPTAEPTTKPTAVPTAEPTAEPTIEPTAVPTAEPTAVPTAKPTAAPTPQADAGQSMTSMAAQVISEVNEERAKYGLSALSVDATLTSAACVRAREIVESFSHTRPDGTSWSTVSSVAYGENIAKGQSSAERVMAAWMSSEGHRENILRESYGSIGVCALKVNGVIYWVQLFGK